MPLTVGVLGMGYVGLTLTAALAQAGHTVYGVDSQPRVVEALRRGRPHIYEPGLTEVFESMVGRTIFPVGELPEAGLDAVMVSVSTPVDDRTHQPMLENLRAAAAHIAQRCGPETLVVVRSTVPIGTSRRLVLPVLLEAWGTALLCMAPERTIQGQALRELVDLPQVVGGLDEPSLEAGVAVFEQLAKQVVPVSSLETAEMVKLSNNCHTDLIYSFGNEIALIAEQHGIDPLEVIRATNLDYPRPDLSKPGFVGGACLTKDPYIMLASSPDAEPFLVGRARELNEHLPVHVAERVIAMVARARGGEVAGGTVGVLGWACKGWPPTDDMRGTAVESMVPLLRAAGLTVLGHDPMVHPDVIAQYGGTGVPLADVFQADGVVIVNDHPEYRALDVEPLVRGGRAAFVYDAWRVLDESTVRRLGLEYAGLGYRSRVAS